MIRKWPGNMTSVLIATKKVIRRGYSLSSNNLIDWTYGGRKLDHGSVEVRENVVSEQEERCLLQELDLSFKCRRVEANHWDSVITKYKEIEKPDKSWGSENAKTIQRLRYELENGLRWPELMWLPVHAIELAADGVINRHVDSVKFSGGIVAGVSLASPSIMRLSRTFTHRKEHYVDMLLPPRSLYILKGEARYDWHHEILRGVCWNGEIVNYARRVSLIFRDDVSKRNRFVD